MTLKEMAKALTASGKTLTGIGRQLRAVDALGKGLTEDAREASLSKIVGDIRVVRHEVSQLADRLGLEVTFPVPTDAQA